jgi:hypothetical protein
LIVDINVPGSPETGHRAGYINGKRASQYQPTLAFYYGLFACEVSTRGALPGSIQPFYLESGMLILIYQPVSRQRGESWIHATMLP